MDLVPRQPTYSYVKRVNLHSGHGMGRRWHWLRAGRKWNQRFLAEWEFTGFRTERQPTHARLFHRWARRPQRDPVQSQNPGGYSNANRQLVSSLDEAIDSWRSDIAQLQSEAIANESNRAQFINTLSPNLAERVQRHSNLNTVIAADLNRRRQLYQEQLQQFSGVLPEFHDNGIKGYSQELRLQ
jgi:hypothetical protein